MLAISCDRSLIALQLIHIEIHLTHFWMLRHFASLLLSCFKSLSFSHSSSTFDEFNYLWNCLYPSLSLSVFVLSSALILVSNLLYTLWYCGLNLPLSWLHSSLLLYINHSFSLNLLPYTLSHLNLLSLQSCIRSLTSYHFLSTLLDICSMLLNFLVSSINIRPAIVTITSITLPTLQLKLPSINYFWYFFSAISICSYTFF